MILAINITKLCKIIFKSIFKNYIRERKGTYEVTPHIILELDSWLKLLIKMSIQSGTYKNIFFLARDNKIFWTVSTKIRS